MTDKTMTLEQVRDEMIQQVAANDYPTMGQVSEWMNAITRHLSQPAERGEAQEKAEPVAWLHQVVAGDGEPDQALSFAPDSFPLDTQLGFRSLGSIPLYTATPPAAGVPDGWKLVPVEPTQEMLDTALRVHGDEAFIAKAPALVSALVKIHKAMLSAAPEATPSPAIDVAAVREVIEKLRILPLNRKVMGISDLDIAKELARAIGDAK